MMGSALASAAQTTLLVLVALSSLSVLSPTQCAEKIGVVTTIHPLGEFIEAIGGDKVAVTVMVPPGSEPHTYEPSPSQMRQVAQAKIYIENGAGLESWMNNIIGSNKRMLLVDSSKNVTFIRSGAGPSEGSRGIDPHIWLSARNAQAQIRNIYQGLALVDPSNQEYYIKNRDAYLQKLKALDGDLNKTFSKHTGNRKFIVLHPAWAYFARDYGLEEIAINLEEKDPGPRYLSEVIDTAMKNNITTIFVEPQFSPKMADVISREIGGKVVSLDPLAENYLENMRLMGQKIADSLRP